MKKRDKPGHRLLRKRGSLWPGFVGDQQIEQADQDRGMGGVASWLPWWTTSFNSAHRFANHLQGSRLLGRHLLGADAEESTFLRRVGDV